MATPQRKNPTVFPYRGKWRLTYVDPTGQTKTKSVESKHDAYKFLIEIGYLRGQGKTITTEVVNFTVGEWLETWMREHSSSHGPTTVETHKSLISNHLQPQLGHLPLRQLSVGHIELMYRSLLVERKLSAASVHHIHALLTISLRDAVRYGLVVANPCDSVESNQFPKRGAGQPFIAKGDVVKYLIPIPSLEVQERLVLGLEEEQAIVDGNAKLIVVYESKIRQTIEDLWRSTTSH